MLNRFQRLAHQHIYHSVLEPRRQSITPFFTCCVQALRPVLGKTHGYILVSCFVQQCSLEAAETELQRTPHPRSWQRLYSGRKFGCLLNRRAAGVAESQHPRSFVKCLSSSIVAGAAQEFVVAVASHQHKLRVTAGYQQADHGEADSILRRWAVFQPPCVHVSLKVVHAVQRRSQTQGDALCVVDADKQRPRQPGASSDGYSIKV